MTNSMIKLTTFMVALFTATTLVAAPVGNTSTPELVEKGLFSSCNTWITISLGYEGDFIADGKMEQHNQGNGRVDTYEQLTNSGVFTLTLVDRIDLYGVLGSSRTKADWRYNSISNQTITRIELETDYDFSWAIGGKAILYQWCNTSLGVGGRYCFSNDQLAWIRSDGIAQSTAGSQFKWKEWQMNLDISYKIDLFTPYIGMKYSYAKTTLRNFSVPISSSLTGSNTFENRNPLGIYLGCTLSTGCYFMMNLEARLIDEEAVTVSGGFKF